jgi:hypothetical protein
MDIRNSQIGDPVRTIEFDPVELPEPGTPTGPDPEPLPAPEPVEEPVPVGV